MTVPSTAKLTVPDRFQFAVDPDEGASVHCVQQARNARDCFESPVIPLVRLTWPGKVPHHVNNDG